MADWLPARGTTRKSQQIKEGVHQVSAHGLPTRQATPLKFSLRRAGLEQSPANLMKGSFRAHAASIRGPGRPSPTASSTSTRSQLPPIWARARRDPGENNRWKCHGLLDLSAGRPAKARHGVVVAPNLRPAAQPGGPASAQRQVQSQSGNRTWTLGTPSRKSLGDGCQWTGPGHGLGPANFVLHTSIQSNRMLNGRQGRHQRPAR